MYHIRRKEKEITDHQILRRILKETKYVTIAMVKDNDPYLVSMSHGYDEKNHCLYLHSANEGKKFADTVTEMTEKLKKMGPNPMCNFNGV